MTFVIPWTTRTGSVSVFGIGWCREIDTVKGEPRIIELTWRDVSADGKLFGVSHLFRNCAKVVPFNPQTKGKRQKPEGRRKRYIYCAQYEYSLQITECGYREIPPSTKTRKRGSPSPSPNFLRVPILQQILQLLLRIFRKLLRYPGVHLVITFETGDPTHPTPAS